MESSWPQLLRRKGRPEFDPGRQGEKGTGGDKGHGKEKKGDEPYGPWRETRTCWTGGVQCHIGRKCTRSYSGCGATEKDKGGKGKDGEGRGKGKGYAINDYGLDDEWPNLGCLHVAFKDTDYEVGEETSKETEEKDEEGKHEERRRLKSIRARNHAATSHPWS